MRGRKILDQEYSRTLNNLFKAVKRPSRHTVSVESTKDVFTLRTEYFRKVMKDSNINQNRTKFIHIAGTKGKGSTCEYISAGLRASGFKVGVFTSPHLHTARERIRINESLISKEDIVRLGTEALESLAESSWSVFFDLFLSVALRYFGEKSVDYVILECGIGGRFDSTNFLEFPEECVITSISLDHQAILGDTIEEIGWQKAGIIKSNCNVFTPITQAATVLDVFRKECFDKSAHLNVVPAEMEVVKSLDLSLDFPVQVQNACLAASVLRHLKVPIEGMRNFYWPCR